MKRIIIGAAVLTGLAALGAAGAACTSAAAPAAHNRVQVLRLHTTDLSDADNPAGHGGPGDVFTVVYDLRTPGGAVTITWAEYNRRVRDIAAGLADPISYSARLPLDHVTTRSCRPCS